MRSARRSDWTPWLTTRARPAPRPGIRNSTDASFIVVAYTTVHFLGIISCWQIHLARRKQYIEHRSEQMTRQELEESLAEIKVLRGIIPICAYCKQIRDDEGFWHQVESYIHRHSLAQFSHGICPDCAQELYPELSLDDE